MSPGIAPDAGRRSVDRAREGRVRDGYSEVYPEI